MSKKILIVEDEEDIIELISYSLKKEGFSVTSLTSGSHVAYEVDKNRPDLILLDLMLPRMDGLTLCNKLRDAGNNTPVLMLTALDSRDDMLKGFQHGADDYLTKPFDLDILEARMTALIKRYRGTVASTKLQYGEVSIDQKTHQAYRQDKLLALNPTTYTILEMLVKNAPEVVTREEIAFRLWQEDEPNNDVLRSHIYQLRGQLDKPFKEHVLKTIPKVGFRLEPGA